MSSRGERNNNPGNLEYGKYAISQGAVGSDGRFAIFNSMSDGIAAQVNLLRKAYIAKGYDTPSEIINRYGNDPGTGDDLSVRNYIKYVASKLGIGIHDQVPVSLAGKLAQAMREFETGKTVSGAIDYVTPSNPLGESQLEKDAGAAIRGKAYDFFADGIVGRSVAIIVGVILVGLAVAAFTLTSDAGKSVIKAVK